MPPKARPFEEQVDRSGEHHLWLGARKADGTGLLRTGGRLYAARQIAWERAHGPVPEGWQVKRCSVAGCVRVDHLKLVRARRPASTKRRSGRGTKGGGSRTEVRPGVWKLTVTAGRYDDGSKRRVHRMVHADREAAAALEQAAFAAEVRGNPLLERKGERDLSVDEAVERFLIEYLEGEKGRERRTIDDYRRLHGKWFAPTIGQRRLRDIDEAVIDEIFGRMRRAGLSRSRMNQARSLYGPMFRWAKRRRIITRDPMVGFEMPTSTQVAVERTPPEVEQLCRLLDTAVELVPDVAPLLTLGAVTGMRRGELVGIRRDRLRPEECEITVDTASDGTRVKTTKTRRERRVLVDAETMAMLVRHCDEMDERAVLLGTTVAQDGFVFSLEADCPRPMPADHVTKRVAVLKEHLGIEAKHPETAAREDEALRLFRQAPPGRPAGRSGPAPVGGITYREIGARLDRSPRWAALAVESAQRREATRARGLVDSFDGSVLALRKFTSSELLDAGFNISAVARRQGHGPLVLMKHYAKGRRSADRRAAEHLGRVVHRD